MTSPANILIDTDLGYETIRVTAGESAVTLSAPPEAIAEFAHLAQPYVTLHPHRDSSPQSPTVLVRRTPPEQGSWRMVSESSEYEPDRVLWVDDERRGIVVVETATAWQGQQALRSVRNLLRWQAYERGELFLHGGLLRLAGRGIAFLGGKRAGKTSSILTMLLNTDAEFVSNDDVVITDGATDQSPLIGYGSPRSINVRTDTLLALAGPGPDLADRGLHLVERVQQAGHPTNLYRGRHYTKDSIATEAGELPGSVWVRSADLAAIAGCRLTAASQLDVVVFPHFTASSEKVRLTELGPIEARRALLANVEAQALKYDAFLHGWFPRTRLERRDQLIERLLREATFLRLDQNMGQLAAAARLVSATVGAPTFPHAAATRPTGAGPR